jgi:hypothetical protein
MIPLRVPSLLCNHPATEERICHLLAMSPAGGRGLDRTLYAKIEDAAASVHGANPMRPEFAMNRGSSNTNVVPYLPIVGSPVLLKAIGEYYQI